jgi:hypothetical protein
VEPGDRGLVALDARPEDVDAPLATTLASGHGLATAAVERLDRFQPVPQVRRPLVLLVLGGLLHRAAERVGQHARLTTEEALD